MAAITGSVGASAGARGINHRHDVAVAQLMLKVVKNPKTHQSFLAESVNGLAGADTVSAIKAFQAGFSLAKPPVPPAPAMKMAQSGVHLAPRPPAAPTAPVPGAPTPEEYGLIGVASPSWQKLLAEALQVHPQYDRLRALPNTKYLYLTANEQEFQAALNEMQNSGLAPTFQALLVAGASSVFRTHGIVLRGWNKAKSYVRSFRDQSTAIHDGSSQAHPGESLHQFGRATDVGYSGLTVILESGQEITVTTENSFDELAKTHGYARQDAFFKIRNDVLEAPPTGSGDLFRIRLHGGKDDDPNHFQEFNQFPNLYPDGALIDLQLSLAALLTKVSSSAGVNVVWKAVPHRPHHYASDLGLGIAPVDVGDADHIWSGHPSFDKSQYVAAINASRVKQKSAALKPSAVPDTDYTKARAALVQAFKDAESRHGEWVPLASNGTPLE